MKIALAENRIEPVSAKTSPAVKLAALTSAAMPGAPAPGAAASGVVGRRPLPPERARHCRVSAIRLIGHALILRGAYEPRVRAGRGALLRRRPRGRDRRAAIEGAAIERSTTQATA